MHKKYEEALQHSWGKSPENKRREKEYNARYYQEHKEKWLKSAREKERYAALNAGALNDPRRFDQQYNIAKENYKKGLDYYNMAQDLAKKYHRPKYPKDANGKWVSDRWGQAEEDLYQKFYSESSKYGKRAQDWADANGIPLSDFHENNGTDYGSRKLAQYRQSYGSASNEMAKAAEIDRKQATKYYPEAKRKQALQQVPTRPAPSAQVWSRVKAKSLKTDSNLNIKVKKAALSFIQKSDIKIRDLKNVHQENFNIGMDTIADLFKRK